MSTAIFTTKPYVDNNFKGKVNLNIPDQLVKTVGAGGDFSTINEALSYFSSIDSLYVAENKIVGRIVLNDDYIMREQVLVENMNLGWVEIISTNASNPSEINAIERGSSIDLEDTSTVVIPELHPIPTDTFKLFQGTGIKLENSEGGNDCVWLDVDINITKNPTFESDENWNLTGATNPSVISDNKATFTITSEDGEFSQSIENGKLGSYFYRAKVKATSSLVSLTINNEESSRVYHSGGGADEYLYGIFSPSSNLNKISVEYHGDNTWQLVQVSEVSLIFIEGTLLGKSASDINIEYPSTQCLIGSDPELSVTSYKTVLKANYVNNLAVAESFVNLINGTFEGTYLATSEGNIINIQNLDKDWQSISSPFFEVEQSNYYTRFVISEGHGIIIGDKIIIKDQKGITEDYSYRGLKEVNLVGSNWVQIDNNFDLNKIGVINGTLLNATPIEIDGDWLITLGSSNWEIDHSYLIGDKVVARFLDGSVAGVYNCIYNHTSYSDSKPRTGINSNTYWKVVKWCNYYQPSFGVKNGTFPVINCLFETVFQNETPNIGLYLDTFCAAELGIFNFKSFSGCFNSGGTSLSVTYSSIANAKEAIFIGSWTHGVWAYGSGVINAEGALIVESGRKAKSLKLSRIDTRSPISETIDGAPDENVISGAGAFAISGSIINLNLATVTNSYSDNIYSDGGSLISCNDTEVFGSEVGLEFGVNNGGLISRGDLEKGVHSDSIWVNGVQIPEGTTGLIFENLVEGFQVEPGSNVSFNSTLGVLYWVSLTNEFIKGTGYTVEVENTFDEPKNIIILNATDLNLDYLTCNEINDLIGVDYFRTKLIQNPLVNEGKTLSVLNGVLDYHSINDLESSVLTSDIHISKWDTRNISEGSSSENQIVLPVDSGAQNFRVLWGDGTPTQKIVLGSNASHTYDVPGIYTIKIIGEVLNFGFDNSGDLLKLIEIKSWGNEFRLISSGAFSGCANLRSLASDIPEAALLSIESLFKNTKIKMIPNFNLWDLSEVTSLKEFLMGASEFIQNVNDLNVSSIITFDSLFSGASKFNSDVSNWTLGSDSVSLDSVFKSCIEFTGEGLELWDMKGVVSIKEFLYNASKVNKYLGNWELTKVEDSSNAFTNSGLSSENYTNTIVGIAKNLYEFEDDGGVLPEAVLSKNMGLSKVFIPNLDITNLSPTGSNWETSHDAKAWMVEKGWVPHWGDILQPQPSKEKLQELVRAGKSEYYFPVGSSLDFTFDGVMKKWDVLGHDHDTPTNTDYTHSMTIQSRECLLNGVISSAQAFFNTVEDLEPGTHVFTMNGVQYEFSTTVLLPAGGVIIITGWGTGDYVPTTARTVLGDRKTIVESSRSVTPSVSASTLMTLNNHTRVRYGSNNYLDSAMRQYLNSTDLVFNWESKTLYDMPATFSGGFLSKLDPNLVSIIGFVDKQVSRNSVNEEGGQDLFSDKVFLLSRVEIFGTPEGTTTRESQYKYWQERNTNDERIKLLNGSARWWWTRSPNVSYADDSRNVYTGGSLNTSGAFSSYGVSPACSII